ncbi:MAG: Chemotaxis response regulator protein-glutamate methylesterase [Marmoricola sp.]|nr:Chemotaxis response regulator protein-glutamate methylesterase [Marmoricola sp.]
MPTWTERAGSTSVLVVDDHGTFADLLALALAGQPDLGCVGTAHSAEEGLVLAMSLQPDVVVMDVRLGSADGLEVTARLTAMFPGLRVIVLTAHATQALLERAVTAGACCLLPKDGSFQEVLSALRSARRGGFVVHPALMRELMTGTRQVAQPAPQLTLREREVLDLLADGHDARAIARALGISLHTCRGHVRSLLTRLNAHSQLQAVANATRVGLVHRADLV